MFLLIKKKNLFDDSEPEESSPLEIYHDHNT